METRDTREEDPRLLERDSRYQTDSLGIRWFYRLKQNESNRDTGLYGYYGPKQLQVGVIIAKDVRGRKKDYKMFAWFDSLASFAIYDQQTREIPGGQCNFYEMIGATTQEQIPYYDIDITPAEAEEISRNYAGETLSEKVDLMILFLAHAINRKLEEVYHESFSNSDGINQTGFMVFRSEYPLNEEGIIPKFSYHITFPGCYFQSYHEMRAFGRHFKETHDIPEQAVLVDDIWSSIRQLRCNGSWKIGKDPSTAKKFFVHQGATPENHALFEVRRHGFVTDIRHDYIQFPNLLSLSACEN